MENDPAIFAVFDAARMGQAMEQAQLLSPDYTSLYKGHSGAVLAPFAPYLFPFASETALSRWFFSHGWGQAWGIFCYSTATAHEVARHLRRFLKVGLEAGKPFYFRFYDPRVLRAFLPSCDAPQLRLFFGPIDYFWVEDEDPAHGLYFCLRGDTLLTQRVSRTELEATFS